MSSIFPSDGARHDLVVIGASAGGVEALTRVVSGLPIDLQAAVLIVLHLAPTSPSALATILARSGPLPCRSACDGDALRNGEILVAPPDRHLVVEDRHVRLTVGPRENGHRPAVDVLFRSAATARDGRVIGVVLSGMRDDGAAGLAVIKSSGGATIVQDPADAMYPGMPASALAHVSVDAVVPSNLVAGTVTAMVRGEQLPDEVTERRESVDARELGSGVTTICPECGGVLSEMIEAGVPQWECRVGHRYSPQSLLDVQGQEVEAALWAAIRALEDRNRLLGRLAGQLETEGQARSARPFRRRAELASDQARVIHDVLAQAASTSLRDPLEGEVRGADGDEAS